MSKTVEMLKNYQPYNEQEAKDLEYIFKAEELMGDILNRTNMFCHFSSSAFIINPEKTKVLCIFHNIYKSWTWVGGHADGDDDMLYVAKKETMEETSLKNFKVLSEEPISVDVLTVNGHYKKGKYVPAHIHLDLAYLFEADEKESVHILEDENSGIAWLTFDELIERASVTDKQVVPVFKKIVERIKLMK